LNELTYEVDPELMHLINTYACYMMQNKFDKQKNLKTIKYI